MMRTVHAWSLLIASLLLAVPAFATTHFLQAGSRPSGLLVGNDLRLHVIEAGAGTNRLAWKTPTGDWHEDIANPVGVDAFYTASGIVAIAPDAAWGCPSLYVVAAGHARTRTSLGTAATLWELSYGTPNTDGFCVPSDTPTWRSLGAPAGGSFANGPATAVAFDPVTRNVWLAVRASTDGHLWTCRRFRQSQACSWQDLTASDPAHRPSPASPIALATQINFDPAHLLHEVELYSVDPQHHLQRYRMNAAAWDPTIPYPSSPRRTVVDFVSINVQTNNGASDVLVAGSVRGTPSIDVLELAHYDTVSGAWSWRQLTDVDLFTPGVMPTTANVAWSPAAQNDHLGTRIWWEGPDRALRNCFLSSLATDTCVGHTVVIGNPGDQVNAAGDTLGGGLWTDAQGDVYLPGSLGGTAEYLFAYHADGRGWSNHLAPRTAFAEGLPNAPRMFEYSTAEFDGTILATGFGFANMGSGTGIWTSTDDGSTWSGPEFPFNTDMGDGGDQNVVFDANGTAFVTTVGAFGMTPRIQNVQIVRRLSPTRWSTPIRIPPTYATGSVEADRPWLAADRSRPSALYLSWSAGGGPDQGRFAYCTGASGCTGDGSDWCGPYTLHTLNGCTGYPGAPGCQPFQTDDGTVWIAVQDDLDCARPDRYPANGIDSAIGFRRINANLSTCMTPAAFAAALSAPECLWYYRGQISSQFNGETCDGIACQPGVTRNFSSSIAPTHDGRNGVGVAVRANRDIATGDLCLDSSSQCRTDIYFAYRDPDRGWCGSSCTWSPTQETMAIVNRDQEMPCPTGGAGLCWVDHIMPSVLALDGGTFEISWMDFRGDPALDLAYSLASSFPSIDHGDGTIQVGPDFFWPGPATSGTLSSGLVPSIGDINNVVGPRLHSHEVETVSGAIGLGVPTAAVLSPVCYPGQ